MSGTLTMQNVTPEFRIIETDQAPDSKMWRIYASGGLLKLGSALDNLTAVQESTFTRDGTVTATRFLGDGGFLTGLNASNISQGTLNNLRLNTLIDSNTTGYAAKLQQARTISLTGDVVGTTTFDGSADASIATTITSLAITLGDDTEGNFVASIAGTANRVLVSGSGSEKAAVTLNLPQDIHAGASPTFLSATFSQTTGSPPFTINSGTKVTSLNADRLDDQEGAYYLNLANTTGNLPFGAPGWLVHGDHRGRHTDHTDHRTDSPGVVRADAQGRQPRRRRLGGVARGQRRPGVDAQRRSP